MLYIISTIQHNPERDITYKGFDTYSDSVMTLRGDILKNAILNNNIQVVNASIQGGNIAIKDWGRGLDLETAECVDVNYIVKHSGPKYVLLAEKNNWYKLVDYTGVLHELDTEAMKATVRKGEVANCSLANTKEGSKLKAVDIYTIQKDREFESLIKSKYEIFIAKACILGYGNVSFEYEIENHTVRLIKYNGSSKDVILPSFITAIKKEAFYWKGIKTLNLNEGLKAIGAMAFGTNEYTDGIERVEIPSTVEIIGLGAFMVNDKLFRSGSDLNTDRFVLLNTKTIVLEQNY